MSDLRIAQLRVDGCENREVTYVRYQFNQQIDIEGQPTGAKVHHRGIINLKVKSTDSGALDLLCWACNSHSSKNGTITFTNKDGGCMKILSFVDAYCVCYEEVYDDKNTDRMFESITIASRLLTITGKDRVEYDNHWAL